MRGQVGTLTAAGACLKQGVDTPARFNVQGVPVVLLKQSSTGGCSMCACMPPDILFNIVVHRALFVSKVSFITSGNDDIAGTYMCTNTFEEWKQVATRVHVCAALAECVGQC
eukprot:1148355-Pelagomonas_calceolata.AAC.2